MREDKFKEKKVFLISNLQLKIITIIIWTISLILYIFLCVSILFTDFTSLIGHILLIYTILSIVVIIFTSVMDLKLKQGSVAYDKNRNYKWIILVIGILNLVISILWAVSLSRKEI